MKTFAAVSVESTITHVTSHSNNTLNNVVTTIAAQVNPPYTTADVLTTSASVNDDVFKSSNLDEEDLQVTFCSHTVGPPLTYVVFTNADPATAIFGLCARKLGICISRGST